MQILDAALSSQVGKVTRRLASVLEGDVFAVLYHSQYVVRSFEFGVVDGAIDCSGPHDRLGNYADRLASALDCASRPPEHRHKLLPFDVKSTILGGGSPGYKTTTSQSELAAFYLGISVTDTDFVELIPNYDQSIPAESILSSGAEVGAQADVDIAFNYVAQARVPPRAFGGLALDNAPFRMPVALLCEAIRRVRQCAVGGHPYVNPWTGVAFPDWRPMTTTDTDMLRPKRDTAAFTSHKEVMAIHRAVCGQPDLPLVFDLVGAQPDLADFKFILHQTAQHPCTPGGKQYFVQHKLDSMRRSPTDQLKSVAICRSSRDEKGRDVVRWYFRNTERYVTTGRGHC